MPLSVNELFERYKERLSFDWSAGASGGKRLINRHFRQVKGGHSAENLATHLNPQNSSCIRVLGSADLYDLHHSSELSYTAALHRIFGEEPVLIIISDGEDVASELKSLAEKHEVAVFSSALKSDKLINHLQYFISSLLADKVTLHGVFMDVKSIGVLMVGDSGIGKSELAFELISRGSRLIADDAPEFSRIAPDTINGDCPPALDGFLEVRGLGILNIRAMFGDNAIKQNKFLRLIINLKFIEDDRSWESDRLHGSIKMRNVLDVDIPEITLPVAPGRNIAVLVEGAALNHILRLKGYDAAQDFISKQQRLIDRDAK